MKMVYVKKVRKMTTGEMKRFGWAVGRQYPVTPYAIEFSDGIIAYPSSDDELNNNGYFEVIRARNINGTVGTNATKVNVKTIEGKPIFQYDSRSITLKTNFNWYSVEAFEYKGLEKETGHIVFYSRKAGEFFSML